MRDNSNYEYCSLQENVVMCPPAIRTVLIMAFCDGPDDEPDHEVHPILAIRSYLGRDYRAVRDGDRDRELGSTHAEMIKLGWRPRSPVMVSTEGVFVDRDYGLMGTLDGLLELDLGCTSLLVPCPWNADEDEARLSAPAGKLRAEAKARAIARASGSRPPSPSEAS